MDWFRSIPMGLVAVVAGGVSAIAWIVWDDTLPLVISIAAGVIIAARATLGDKGGTES